MTDVSTQIYQPFQANQQQLNPLQVLQMIGQINSNRLFEQEIQSRQAIGDAYRNSVDPTTGQLDTDKLQRLTPLTGYHAPEAVRQGIAASTETTGLKSTYQQILRQTFGALASKPTITDQDISAAMVDAGRQGVPGGFIQSYLSSMPQGNRRTWAVTQQNLSQNPETIAQGTEGPIDASGVRPQITRGRAAYEMASAGASPGGMRTTLPIGEGDALARSAADITALRSKNTSYPNDMVAINGLIHSLQAVGAKGSGPGTSELNTLKSALYSNFSWVPGVEKAVGDPQVMADYASGEKYAKQLATSLAENIGPGTNQGLTTAFGSSPNMNISNLAGTQLAKTLYGIRNMQQAMQIAFDKTGLPANQFHNWARQNWSTKVNPAGFMWDQLDDKEQDQVLKKIDANPKTAKAERAKLNASIHQAVTSGLMADPFANQ